MPNYCSNFLEFPEGDRESFLKFMSRDPEEKGRKFLNFNKIKRKPPKVDGYEWSVKNWGTKWNSFWCDETESGLAFTTAWSPPTPVVLALSKKVGKPLRLIYSEMGMGFCGEFLAEPDGAFADNYYDDWRDAPQGLKDELGLREEDWD